MAHDMRLTTLKSAVEAAGVAMAPSSDQFEGEAPHLAQAAPDRGGRPSEDAGNYSRTWARPVFREGFDTVHPARQKTLRQWFALRWPGVQST
jgi:hypothetical protein